MPTSPLAAPAAAPGPDDGSPRAWRRRIRSGAHAGHTAGLAPGYLQGNLAIVPEPLSRDFLLYCHRNPKPCPLIGVSDPGDRRVPVLGEDLDLATDLPAYRAFDAAGRMRTVADLVGLWRDDLVGFVLGCSFSFDEALGAAGLPVRHVDAGRNVPMYRTSIPTRPAGPFEGPLVVSLRGFAPRDAIRAIVLSERHPLAHGAPVHLGDPTAIGIGDLDRPDFGDPPALEPGDVPVFWACGVTPQLALASAGAELAIVHEPGCMLITDVPADAAGARLAGP